MAGDTREYTSYEEFWPFYLGEHRNPVCRALHYLGTTSGLLMLLYAIVTLQFWLIPVGFVMGYGPAWVAHFFIEHNRPATFKYPLWSFRSDLRMVRLFFTGKIGDELVRLYGSRNPAKDAPLRPQG